MIRHGIILLLQYVDLFVTVVNCALFLFIFADQARKQTWSSVEANAGLVCASLPCIRPLLAVWLPKIFTTRHISRPTCDQISTKPLDRSTYERHDDQDFMLVDIEKNTSRQSSEPERANDAIQVITEVCIAIGGRVRQDRGLESAT